VGVLRAVVVAAFLADARGLAVLVVFLAALAVSLANPVAMFLVKSIAVFLPASAIALAAMV
jgi:hypothetical protein